MKLQRIVAVTALVAASALLGGAEQPAQASGFHSYATPVSKTKSVERVYLDDGQQTVVDKPRTVSLTVSQTTNLRSLQLIHVSWSGAHPTGGIVPDQNSDLAQNEEYPMVLLECRGVDSDSAPKKQQISPETCWTQFADERFNYGYNDYPAWRSDLYATNDERAAFVNRPAGLPKVCRTTLIGTENQRWVPFLGADGTEYPGGPFSCAGSAPEASPANYSSLSLPSNETFGVTGLNGSGSADFDVFTAEDHASLGCSATVPCSLVAVPIEGVSCDAEGSQAPAADRPDPNQVDDARRRCETSGNYAAGSTLPSQGSGQPAVSGALWWSASNWRNRITVPLSFAEADDVCSLNGSGHEVDVYGSELMIQATTQWAPSFCLNSKLFNFSHVQTPEPEARSLLATGNISAAFTSQPPDTPYPNPTVTAPVAVTGFGISFVVDNAKQQPARSLNLDPRLLAKLLTESYPDQTFVKNNYAALANNPLNITQDPEFQALNPGIPKTVSDSASTLLALSSDSDVMYALTSYINADPDARAWLDGQPDPWGMVVNPNYQGIDLPVDSWPLLDTYKPLSEYQPGKNDCLYADPVPYLPLVAAPTSRLYSIGQDMQFGLAQSQTVCVLPSPIPGSYDGAKLVAVGREATGHRFMLGVVSLGDAQREGLRLADLESQRSATAPVTFTDTTGRTFVGPSDASLKAAASMLMQDKKTGTWPIPYRALRNDQAGASAYPGTMVVYAAVPLSGLVKTDATDLSKLLTFAAGDGQRPGAAAGELPPGFLPMTSANGLGDLVQYTEHAAVAVAAQQGTLNPTSGSSGPKHHHGGGHHHSGSEGSSSPPSHTPGTQPAPPAANPVPGAGAGVSSSAGTKPSGSTSANASSTPPASSAPTSVDASPVAGTTPEVGSRLSGALLPLVLLLFAASLVAACVVRLRARGSRSR